MSLSLRIKFTGLIAGLLTLNLVGAVITLFYAYNVYNLYSHNISTHIKALMMAEKLETSLVMQKGYVTYYFLSSDTQWLEKLKKFHGQFEKELLEARQLSLSDLESSAILSKIDENYRDFSVKRDYVVSLYQERKSSEAVKIHWSVRDQFHSIYELAEKYKRLQESKISQLEQLYNKKTRYVTIVAALAIPLSCFLAFVLAWVFLKQILSPIRLIAHALRQDREFLETEQSGPSPNELFDLRERVEKLLETVDNTQTALQESREHLIQSEKMALVGRLAAGVAHSVLNPLTSVKMRLFSLERSINLSASQKEDFEVISEEIRHIDTILRNFLEFSRPPKPKFQNVSLSDVVDMTLQLLKHRIDSYNVKIKILRNGKLTPVEADPDQLKEALANLILNACEAMGEGGEIEIEEDEGVVKPQGRVVMLKVKDKGPGISEAVIDKIFEPFFSTKEEGSGLGLSIVKRIIEDHNGWVNCKSQEGVGTTFIIVLPCKERNKWLRS